MTQGELPAHQKRSRAAREKIVQALDDALREKPFDQISVAEIARGAGVAVGTVYQRFKNKEALIPVVLEIYQQRVQQWATKEGRIELADSDDLKSALRKVFRQSWSVFKREAHLLRTVHLHVRLNPELAEGDDWKGFERATAESLESIRGLLMHYSHEVKRANVDRAADFVAFFFNAIMVEKGLYPELPPASFFKPKGTAFADECADMLYGYLTCEG